jgi:tripartite-type tricarboxylate transporter receptor subunit TctC
MKLLKLACVVAGASAVARPALALDYPTRPVRFVVGFPPGGQQDIMARLIGQWLSERLGQQFPVENRSGAGGQHRGRGGDQFGAGWLHHTNSIYPRKNFGESLARP